MTVLLLGGSGFGSGFVSFSLVLIMVVFLSSVEFCLDELFVELLPFVRFELILIFVLFEFNLILLLPPSVLLASKPDPSLDYLSSEVEFEVVF